MMGLFDKLFGRSANVRSDSGLPAEVQDTATAPAIISRAIAERDCSLSKAIKLSLADTAVGGASLAQLAPTLKTIAHGSNIGNGSLVRVVFPVGVKGHLAMDQFGLSLGGILKDGGGLAQARLVAIDPVSLEAQAGMAVILYQVNSQLQRIQETQQDILNFLEQDKRAEQQGNLNVLTETLEGYVHNWDNAQYLQNHHMKVLDIKQSAEKNIIFYQEQIANAIKKLPGIHTEKSGSTMVANLGKLFGDYRLATYLFSFASFLEVLLLGNFQEGYLNQAAAKVQKYQQQYQSQFSECGDMVRRFSADSVNMKVLSGIGSASRTLGKLIASAPVLSQGPVDEWLLKSGDKLINGKEKKAAAAETKFRTEGAIDCDAFVDNIRLVSRISNQVTDILFDEENVYLAGA